MRVISYMLASLSLGLSAQAMDLAPVIEKIKQNSCAQALEDKSKPLLLVVGLGNFGYAGTRHNVGDELVKQIESRAGAESQEAPEFWTQYMAKDEADAADYMDFSGASSPRRGEGLMIEYRVGGLISVPKSDSPLSNIVFVHPYYDINESGIFVSELAKALGLGPQQLVVVVDDLTLARNQMVLGVGKPDGKGDGHNGLKSINQLLGQGDYYRLRIGISNPKSEKVDIERGDWVLGQIPPEDLKVLFADNKLDALQSLLINIQQRSNPAAHAQKLTAEGSGILKQLNEK